MIARVSEPFGVAAGVEDWGAGPSIPPVFAVAIGG